MTSDSVLQEENKENTKAINVDYYSVVALISPIVDGTDLTKVALIGGFTVIIIKKIISRFLLKIQKILIILISVN